MRRIPLLLLLLLTDLAGAAGFDPAVDWPGFVNAPTELSGGTCYGMAAASLQRYLGRREGVELPSAREDGEFWKQAVGHQVLESPSMILPWEVFAHTMAGRDSLGWDRYRGVSVGDPRALAATFVEKMRTDGFLVVSIVGKAPQRGGEQRESPPAATRPGEVPAAPAPLSAAEIAAARSRITEKQLWSRRSWEAYEWLRRHDSTAADWLLRNPDSAPRRPVFPPADPVNRAGHSVGVYALEGDLERGFRALFLDPNDDPPGQGAWDSIREGNALVWDPAAGTLGLAPEYVRRAGIRDGGVEWKAVRGPHHDAHPTIRALREWVLGRPDFQAYIRERIGPANPFPARNTPRPLSGNPGASNPGGGLMGFQPF